MQVAAAVATMLIAACADGPVEPAQDDVDFELASFDVLGDGYGYGPGGMGEPGAQSGVHVGARLGGGVHAPGLPVLGRLLAQAWTKAVNEFGREAAYELFSTLHALRQEAHRARQAGDRALFREKVTAAHEEAARLIAEILGPDSAERLIELAKTNLALLDQVIARRIEAGLPVQRLEHASTLAGQLMASAELSLTEGDVVAAMIQAGRAAQLAQVAARYGRIRRS